MQQRVSTRPRAWRRGAASVYTPVVIVDFHTHIFPPDVIANREAHLKEEDWFARLYGSPRALMARASELIEEMDRCGVDRAVVCGFAWDSFDLYVKTNDYIADAVSRHPDRLVGFANVPPQSSGAREELERCLGMGLKGLGELKPDGQGFDLEDEEGLAPVLSLAAERRLPILMHVSEPVGRRYPGKGSTSPRKSYDFAGRHPELKLIYAHWGGGLPFYELMPEVKEVLANVYYDCSASPFLYCPDVYRLAVEIVGSRKILFGSDYPLIPMDRYMEEIRSAGLEGDDYAAIMGESSRALLEEMEA